MMALGKAKVRNITGHEGPEGEYGYNSTLSLTSSVDEGEWLTPRPGRFTPGNDPVPIAHEAGWTSGPVWWGAENVASRRGSIPGPSIP
jgi:hypothetical protein